MDTLPQLVLLIAISVISAEERLSWFTSHDPDMKQRSFVPDNLSEGKEENRLLPWVYHDNEKTKTLTLKCIMRGYNATNNPIDYKDARWSYQGFDKSQVNTNIPADNGTDNGEQYKIWTIEINTTSADSGRKLVTCDFQQGDFPKSIDFIFLLFKVTTKVDQKNGTALLSFGLGENENLKEKDLNKQIEDDIKSQICEHYYPPPCNSHVTRSRDGQTFLITVPDLDDKTGSTGLSGAQIFCIVLLIIIVTVVMVVGVVMACKDEKIKNKCGFVQCVLCCANMFFHCGCRNLVGMFLERNQNDIEMTDQRGRTPLMGAAKEGHSEMVALLIEHNANIEIKDSDGNTPIILAAKKGHGQTVTILIEKGADIEQRDLNGCTPLMLAAHGGHTEVVRMLCEKGVNVNGRANNHYTAIMWAASAGHTDTVKLLCDKKADLKSKDEENNDAAMIAANAGHKETEKVITEYSKK